MSKYSEKGIKLFNDFVQAAANLVNESTNQNLQNYGKARTALIAYIWEFDATIMNYNGLVKKLSESKALEQLHTLDSKIKAALKNIRQWLNYRGNRVNEKTTESDLKKRKEREE